MTPLEARAAAARARLVKAGRARARADSRLEARAAEMRIQLDPETLEARAEWLEREAGARWAAAAIRDAERDIHLGHVRGAANCASCGHFKAEPAAVCGWCGDDPVVNAGIDPDAVDRMEYNRARGRAF